MPDKKLLLVILLCLLAASPCLAESFRDSAEQLVYMTEEFEPYNYKENGQATGLSVVILRLMWKRMGVPEQPIHFMPWPRVYNSAQKDTGVAALSTFRTAEREDLFKWVGPIAHGRISIFTLKTRDITIQTFQDLAKFRIGSVRDMAATPILDKPGFNVTISNRVPTGIRMLESDRIDALALDDYTFFSSAKEMDYPPNHFKRVWVLREKGIYFFFSKDVSDELIDRFQEALDEIKQTPAYRNLLNRYLN